jgi:hypothetical protein
VPPRRRRARGHIEQLRSGGYRAVVYVGIDPLTRKERYLKETANSYAQAKVALTRLQREVDEEAHPKTRLTIGQAIQQWLDVAELEDTTRERYEDLIRLYVMPTFGDLPAAKLDAELLERFYARVHRCRELCSGRSRAGHTCRPLSSSTTRKIHYIIRGTLERAVRWHHLGVNKAAFAGAWGLGLRDRAPGQDWAPRHAEYVRHAARVRHASVRPDGQLRRRSRRGRRDGQRVPATRSGCDRRRRARRRQRRRAERTATMTRPNLGCRAGRRLPAGGVAPAGFDDVRQLVRYM